MLLVSLLLALQVGVSEPEATPVADIYAVLPPMDYRLRVNLSGADTAADLVVSADPGMFCGNPLFDRTPGPYRQCWLRGRRGEPIQLTAQHAGEFGRDWTVDWTGCEPQGDGRTCVAPIMGEMVIDARLRAL